MNKEMIDTSNVNPKYWEKILADEGLYSKLPNTINKIAKKHNFTQIIEFRDEFDNVRAMQDITDNQVEEENKYGDPTLAKDGLPPCLRLKIDREEKGIK